MTFLIGCARAVSHWLRCCWVGGSFPSSLGRWTSSILQQGLPLPAGSALDPSAAPPCSTGPGRRGQAWAGCRPRCCEHRLLPRGSARQTPQALLRPPPPCPLLALCPGSRVLGCHCDSPRAPPAAARPEFRRVREDGPVPGKSSSASRTHTGTGLRRPPGFLAGGGPWDRQVATMPIQRDPCCAAGGSPGPSPANQDPYP